MSVAGVGSRCGTCVGSTRVTYLFLGGHRGEWGGAYVRTQRPEPTLTF